MFLGLDLTAWTAILALVTVVALAVTIWLSVTERRRDDTRRRKDRERDDRLRAEQQARDDRMHQEAAEETERRELAERKAREDYEARQVVDRYDDLPGSLIISAPHSYMVKQIHGAWVYSRNGNLSVVEFDRHHDDPKTDDHRTYYEFKIRTDREAESIIRFTDWHGNLYFRYRGYTIRGKQNTTFLGAAQEIDLWIRTGPKPD
jgi:hypothetical protein